MQTQTFSQRIANAALHAGVNVGITLELPLNAIKPNVYYSCSSNSYEHDSYIIIVMLFYVVSVRK